MSHTAARPAPAVWKIFAAIAAYAALWAASTLTWGVPGLYLPALAKVPVMFALLVWISRG
jgi:hypothetical protein